MGKYQKRILKRLTARRRYRAIWRRLEQRGFIVAYWECWCSGVLGQVNRRLIDGPGYYAKLTSPYAERIVRQGYRLRTMFPGLDPW